MKDWVRNSIQMYSRAFYSHKELHNKNIQAMHELLYAKGKNWSTDLTSVLKNGTLLVRGKEGKVEEILDFDMNYQSIKAIMLNTFPIEE
jgi:hypothetical protein